MIPPPLNILSIQSWVAYGHVGNAAAMFVLQRLGFEVWAVQTVQFSNHTGYGSWRGQVYPPDSVTELIAGIAERGVLSECSAVLSGYLGSADTALAILSGLSQVRAANPAALYCCDPVMGDVGRGLFVAPDIPGVIGREVLPQADILTPNLFELELLGGRTVRTLADALDAAHSLRERMRQAGPRIVLVTSLFTADTPPGHIDALAATPSGAWLVRTPLLDLDPPRNGTGDAITALFLGHYLHSRDVAGSLSLAVSGLYALLDLTQQLGSREIALVAAQEQYARPARIFKAQRVE